MKSYIDSPMKDISIVAYHDNCSDGCCAAAVVYEKFPDAMYVPVNYKQEAELLQVMDNCPGPILFVDFCPEREFLEKMTADGREWYVIDHHESRSWVAEYPNAMFDVNHSGAYLTWEFFNTAYEAPALVRYVQDRDLWVWQLEHSREVNAYIREWPLKVGIWAERMRNLNVQDAIRAGQETLRVQGIISLGMAKKAKLVRIAGEAIMMTNCTTLISETCEHILNLNPGVNIAATFFVIPPSDCFLSFRSRKDGTCLPLAQRLGGGGHPNSAGAKMTLELFSHAVERI